MDPLLASIDRRDRIPPLSAPQLRQYLDRIGLGDDADVLATGPSVAVLDRVVAAHASHIPFATNDIVLLLRRTRPVSLLLDDIHDQLVVRRRGGFCFQQNTLLAAALTALGFSRMRYGVARSAQYDPDGTQFWGGPTHMILLLQLPRDGGRDLDNDDDLSWYLADCGYHSIGLNSSIPIFDGAEVASVTTERHRITRGGPLGSPNEEFTMWHKRAPGSSPAVGADSAGWAKQMTFSMESFRPYDYHILNFFASMSPTHRWTNDVVLSLALPNGRKVFYNAVLRTYSATEPERKTELGSVDEIRDAVETHFGVVMSDMELDRARELFFSSSAR